MACGTPVIASNAASLPETVGDAAKTFSPADGLALTRLLIQVLEDPMLRQEMRSKGRDQAARFDWRLTAEQTLQVYREVLSEGGARR
jgi:alpha-1,3-rhamnosyl/mannosyltransferase